MGLYKNTLCFIRNAEKGCSSNIGSYSKQMAWSKVLQPENVVIATSKVWLCHLTLYNPLNTKSYESNPYETAYSSIAFDTTYRTLEFSPLSASLTVNVTSGLTCNTGCGVKATSVGLRIGQLSLTSAISILKMKEMKIFISCHWKMLI